MDLRPYFGKNVIVTDVDNIIYKGFVSIIEIPVIVNASPSISAL